MNAAADVGGGEVDEKTFCSTDIVGNGDIDSTSEDRLPNYDESSYPADADSGGDEESSGHSDENDLAQVTDVVTDTHFKSISSGGGLAEQREVSLSDDILCAVCAEVFVEPCTLHCGHSFCQLCLAALWKSSRKKSPLSLFCPVCRQPWVNFPGVNIQLRNIIEKAHGESVAGRLACRSQSDEMTLVQFKKAVDGDWRKERQQTRHQLRLVPGSVVILLLLGCALAIIILALVLLMLSFSGGSSEFVQKPVEQWNNADVMAWLEGLGNWATDGNISHVFLKEKITGAQLKLLDESSLKSLGVHVDYFKTQSLLLAIENLRQTEYVRPRNFNEFMSAHRKQTVLVGVLYKFWPRFTFFYLFCFEYDNLFLPLWQYSASNIGLQDEEEQQQQHTLDDPSVQQLCIFGMELLLVPHYVVGLLAWHWFSQHPWLCTAVMIHCLWATQNEAKKAVAFVITLTQINWRLRVSQTIRLFFKSMFKFIVLMSGGFMMWPVVPYIVCDGLFYLVVWNTVYTRLLVTPWRLFNARRQRVNRRPHHQALP